MSFVVVALIAREEQQIGVLGLDVTDDVGAGSTIAIAVTGKCGDNNLVLIDRIVTNRSFVSGSTGVRQPVTNAV